MVRSERLRANSKQWLTSAARAGLGLCAVLALLHVIGRKDLARAAAIVARVGWPLALVPLPTLVAMALDARALQRILSILGRVTSWPRLLSLRISVEAIVLALPGGSVAGEALKITLLRRGMGIPIGTAAASLALVKLLLTAGSTAYLACAAGVAAWSLVRRPDAVSVVPMVVAAVGVVLTGGLSLILRSALRSTSLVKRVEGWLAWPRSRRVRRWLQEQRGEIETVAGDTRRFFEVGTGARLRCFALLALEWFVEGLETFLILRCLSAHVSLGEAWIVDSVGSLLRVAVFFVPAGLGVQDGAQVALLELLGIGDAVTTGAAFIFIKRTKELLWIVTGGIFLAVRNDVWRSRNPRSTM